MAERERERVKVCERGSTGRCVCYRGDGRRECGTGGVLAVTERKSRPGWFCLSELVCVVFLPFSRLSC